MANWGWRPCVLLVFICVLIVACSDTTPHRPSLATTDLPPITLVLRISTETPPTIYNLPILVTPRPQPPLITTTSMPEQNLPTPLPLDVESPTCYEMPHDGVACLGWVNNPYNHALERVILRVDVLDTEAALLDTVSVTLPQHIISPGGSAPYQALFAGAGMSSAQFGGVSVDVIRAEPIQLNADKVVVDDVQGGRVDNLYRVTGQIRNESEHIVPSVRVVVTVYNDEEQVMGFRTVEVYALQVGETRKISVNVMPQINDMTLFHTLHVEQVTNN